MKIRTAGIVLVVMAVALIAGASGCGGSGDTVELELAPESALPDFIQDQPANVKIAYRFAIANPEALSQFPCYCGCGSAGHKDNLGCYIKGIKPDGAIEFDTHALG